MGSASVMRPRCGAGQESASGYSNTAPNGVSLSSDVSPLMFDALGRALNTGGSPSDAIITVAGLQVLVVGESGFVYAP